LLNYLAAQAKTKAGPAVNDQSRSDQQNWAVADGFFELIGNIVGQAEQLAQGLGVPAPFIKALHTLDCPMAMKELGKRMHCDPSFVTLVADMLEKRGLARREPHPADRRVKNIVLTEDGIALKQKVEAEITARMPWNRALDDNERAQLLALIRKMLSADDHNAGAAGHDSTAGSLASLLVSTLHEHAQNPASTNATPPASAGEVNSAVSEATTAR
jgi:MarR family transcriptional regulator, organic hydroperoxide resistance regulator